MTDPYGMLVDRAMRGGQGMDDWILVLGRVQQREEMFRDLQKDLHRKHGKYTTRAGAFDEDLWKIVDRRLPRIHINDDGTIDR